MAEFRRSVGVDIKAKKTIETSRASFNLSLSESESDVSESEVSEAMSHSHDNKNKIIYPGKEH